MRCPGNQAIPFLDGPYQSLPQKKIASNNHIDAQKIKKRATKSLLHEGKLLQNSVTVTAMHPSLQCLHPEEDDLVLLEIHEGVCENHVRVRILVHKSIR